MTTIDPTARIAKGAAIGNDVTIGPYCIIGPNVTIGDGCELQSHVNVAGHTTIGPRTVISPFASLGTIPQSVHYAGEPSLLAIGSDCQIRESVTVHIGTEKGRNITTVGDNCFLMGGVHVAHDCILHNHAILAQHVTLGGFCEVGEHAFIGGMSGVHQFVRIGEQAMIGGLSGVTSDVIPFGMVEGHRSELRGVNRIGMRRRGMSHAEIRKVYDAYCFIYFGPGIFAERVDQIAKQRGDDPHIGKIIAFIRAPRKRYLMHAMRDGREPVAD